MKKYLFKTIYTDMDGDEVIRYTGKPNNNSYKGNYIEYPDRYQLLKFANKYGFDTELEAARCPITLFIDITNKQISESQKVSIIGLECNI